MQNAWQHSACCHVGTCMPTAGNCSYASGPDVAGIEGHKMCGIGQVMVRDIYKGRDIGLFRGTYRDVVDAHGVLALKLTPTRWVPELARPCGITTEMVQPVHLPAAQTLALGVKSSYSVQARTWAPLPGQSSTIRTVQSVRLQSAHLPE